MNKILRTQRAGRRDQFKGKVFHCGEDETLSKGSGGGIRDRHKGAFECEE